jgi:hypothetical protein
MTPPPAARMMMPDTTAWIRAVLAVATSGHTLETLERDCSES